MLSGTIDHRPRSSCRSYADSCPKASAFSSFQPGSLTNQMMSRTFCAECDALLARSQPLDASGNNPTRSVTQIRRQTPLAQPQRHICLSWSGRLAFWQQQAYVPFGIAILLSSRLAMQSSKVIRVRADHANHVSLWGAYASPSTYVDG